MKTYEEYLQERIDELEAENELLKRGLDDIEAWANAYPVDVFVPPTKEERQQFNDVMEKAGFDVTTFNADLMRHVISGVKNIIAVARTERKEDEER